MYKFSKTSLDKLETCHPDLTRLMIAALNSSPMDFSVICGYRNKEDQNKAFDKKTTTLKYPESKHNKIPSMAVDIAPYPINWNDIDSFKQLGEYVKKVAKDLDISIWWGGDWKSFKDYPRFELLSW